MKIVIRGYKNQSGFGVALINLLKVLDKSKYDFRFIPLNAIQEQDDSSLSNDTQNFIKSITINENDSFINDSIFIDIGSLNRGEISIRPKNVKKYILYTTTETTRIDPYYSNIFNKKFDEIWTASRFNKATLYSSGVEKPIKILPHAIDTDIYIPGLPEYKITNKRKFNFLINIDFSFRKGIHKLLPAWLEVFNSTDDVALIMKLSEFDFKDSSRPLKSLNNLLFQFEYTEKDHAPIIVMSDLINEKYIPNMYSICDVYIAPTLGEGFGFPIAEAMSCGKPTITSGCSAPLDYVTNDNGFIIDLDDTKMISKIVNEEGLLMRDQRYKDHYLYDISVESLSYQLEEAYNMSKEELITKGSIARNDIIDKYSLQSVVSILTQLLEE